MVECYLNENITSDVYSLLSFLIINIDIRILKVGESDVDNCGRSSFSCGTVLFTLGVFKEGEKKKIKIEEKIVVYGEHVLDSNSDTFSNNSNNDTVVIKTCIFVINVDHFFEYLSFSLPFSLSFSLFYIEGGQFNVNFCTFSVITTKLFIHSLL